MVIVVSLILLGLVLLLVELLLVPGVGIAGIAGLCSLGAACWYSWTQFGQTTGLIVTGICAVLVLIILFYVLRAKTWKRFALETNIDATVEHSVVSEGQEGVTASRLAPSGMARFDDASVEVKSANNDMVEAGVKITVISTKDNIILVKPINQ